MLQPYRNNNSNNVQRSRSIAPTGQVQSYKNNHKIANYRDDDFMSPMLMNNNDIFQDMHQRSMQMMKHMDEMSNRMMSRFGEEFGFPKMPNLFKEFGNIEQHMNSMMHNFDADIFHGLSSNGQGTVISKSYASSTKVGPDGKKYQEKYISNNVQHKGKDGQKISEKCQAYKNNQGLQKIAQERMLNDQGRKFIRERNIQNGDETVTNLYHNMDETYQNQFDSRWMDYNQKVGFTQQYKNALGHTNSPHQLHSSQYQQQVRSPQYQNQNYRGEYIPDSRKYPNQPVQLQRNNEPNFNRVRQADIQPIMIGYDYQDNNRNVGNQSNIQERPLIQNNQNVNNNDNLARSKVENSRNIPGVYKNVNSSKNGIPQAG